MTPRRALNQHYLEGPAPWDTNTPSPELVAFVRDSELVPGRALDIGCGTGLHARWLAAQGFDVVGVDISAIAIERARATTRHPSGNIRFVVLDCDTDRPVGSSGHSTTVGTGASQVRRLRRRGWAPV